MMHNNLIFRFLTYIIVANLVETWNVTEMEHKLIHLHLSREKGRIENVL